MPPELMSESAQKCPAALYEQVARIERQRNPGLSRLWFDARSPHGAQRMRGASAWGGQRRVFAPCLPKRCDGVCGQMVGTLARFARRALPTLQVP